MPTQPLIHEKQVSFGKGEWTPALAARVDLQGYASALKTARNVNVCPQGGIRNRPGTRFVAAAADSTHPVRLVPFSASATQTYVIELGHYYARFYYNQAPVTVPAASAWVTGTAYVVGNFVSNGGNIYYCIVANTSGATFAADLAAGKWRAQTDYQIVTPWSSADIFQLKFAQSADVLYVAHPGYAPRTLTFYSSCNWALSAYTFLAGPFMVENTDQAFTITPSGVACGAAISLAANKHAFYAGQVGALFQLIDTISSSTIAKVFTGAYDATTAPNQVSGTLQCGHNWSIITSGFWIGTISIQVSIDNGATWETIQNISSSAIDDNFATAGDTGFDQCLIRMISGGSWITGFTAWAPREDCIAGVIYEATSYLGTPWPSYVKCLIKHTASNNIQDDIDKGNMQVLSATCNLTAATFNWIGVVQITGVTSGTAASATVLPIGKTTTGLANTSATWQWSEGSWSTYRGWPSCVTFFQDRLCWAGTPAEPQTIQLSRTGSYPDFSTSEPIQADDAFSIVLPSRTLNSIQNIVVMPQGLVALTTDTEWLIQPGAAGLASTDVSTLYQGSRGSSAISPAVVGIEMLLMQRMGSVMRNLIYQLAVNGYFGDNISLSSQHLFTGYTIVELAYQQEPDSILWAVRSDGVLLSCTYMRDQEMNAWTRHDTLGKFESVCVIPDYADGYNQPWFVVNRTLNGQTVRCIEYLASRDMGTDPADQYFVDCGISYAGSPATVFNGLNHLEGLSVAVLADGNVSSGMAVGGGAITLPQAASKVQVGLPFVSDVETLRIEAWTFPGTSQGRRIAIPEAILRFWNSRGGYLKAMSQDSAAPAATGTAGFDPIHQRNASDDPTQPMPLRTYDYKLTLNGGYDFGAHLFYRQVDPLPFHLLGIFPKAVVSES